MSCVVTHYRSSRAFGGVERYIISLCKGMASRSIVPTLIYSPDSPLVAIPELQEYARRAISLRGDFNVAAPFITASILRAFRAQILHIHDGNSAFWPAVGGRIAGVVTVATVHSVSSITQFRPAHHLIAVCEDVRRHCMAQGVAASRITTVCNGVDLAHYQPCERAEARKRFALSDETVFLFIGRLVRDKGIHLLLEAFNAVWQTHPHSRLLILGDGPDFARITERNAALGMTAAVSLLGFMPDVRPALAAADCLVLPSETEGLNLTILEAMAMSRAVIATDCGGTREAVLDKRTGLLIPINDGEALESAMRQMLHSHAFCDEAGLAGHARVTQCFSLADQLNGIVAIYEQLLQRPCT